MRRNNTQLPYRCRGFSLIATLLIVAMVAIAIAGFLSVVTTETSTTRFSTQRAEARANAMVGLRKAIAQLQEHAGADQRVTATAAILDSGAESENLVHRYWTGVWSTAKSGNANARWIERDVATGSLIDRRSEDDSFYDSASKEGRALVWLVSGDGTEIPTNDFEEDDEAVIAMIRSYEPDNPARPGEVRVRKVELRETRDKKVRTRGHYAYWVADEGVKAKINVFNPYYDAPMVPDEAARHGYRQLYLAPAANYSLLLKNPDMNEHDKRKILTSGQVMAYQKDIPDDFNRRLNTFHSTTAYSLGVLSDVRDGGLKQDLTPYLRGDTATGDIRDDTSIFEGFPGIAPEFGRLKNWARAGDEFPFDIGKAAELTIPAQHSASNEEIDRAHLFLSSQLSDLGVQDRAIMKPVLIEAALSYAVSRFSEGQSTRLRMHMYPRVVLWNPYSVSLGAQRLAVAVTGSSFNLQIDLESQTGGTVGRRVQHIAPNTEDPENPDHRGDSTGTYCFTLAPIEMGPGECLVFSPATTVSKPYSRTSPGTNVLSATVEPGAQNFSLDDCFLGDAIFPAELKPIGYQIINGRRPLDDQMQLRLAESASFSVQQMGGFPLLQIVSARHSPAVATGRSGTGGGPLETSQTQMPAHESYEGCRMRWWNGDGRLPVSLLHYNLQGVIHLVTPWDPQRLEERLSLYQFDAANAKLALATFQAHSLPDRKWGGNPFASPSDWALDRYVLFDVPRAHTGVLSMAQFQHVALSAFGWDPLYGIGNSLIPPTLRYSPARTVPEFEGGDAGWNVQMLKARPETAKWLQSLVQGKHEELLVRDTSYEANHALWDRYFLSGATGKELRSFAADPASRRAHLPNTRLVLNDFVSREGAVADLNHAEKAASRLLLNGAFNVHCTEPEAWAMMLAANRGRALGGEANLAMTPFPRFADPASGALPSASLNSEAAWSGYRVLGDIEIEKLANAIAAEVKKRAPFISMADFVNRRLVDDNDTGRAGTLQAAIDQSGINAVDEPPVPGSTVGEGTPGGTWGLTQADLLSALGPVLTARSDTFLIKAYGDAVGINGRVVSRAGCEAVVQRTPEPVDRGTNPTANSNLGRKFRIISFRWTGPAS